MEDKLLKKGEDGAVRDIKTTAAPGQRAAAAIGAFSEGAGRGLVRSP